jgi:hypothetical protein
MRRRAAELLVGLHVWAGLAASFGLLWLVCMPDSPDLTARVALGAAIGAFSAAAAGRLSRKARVEVAGTWAAALVVCALLVLGVADATLHPYRTWGTEGPDGLIRMLQVTALVVLGAASGVAVVCAVYVSKSRRWEESA